MRYRFHHVLFWCFFGAAWYYLRYQDYSSANTALLITLVKVVDLALMVYIANYVLIPAFLYRKKPVVFACLLLAMILLSSASKMYIIGTILHNPALYHFTGQLKERIYDNVLPHIFLVIAGMAFKLLIDYNKAQKHLLQAAKEKAEAELNFLKAQINPHFLFNSLNAVYFLIDKNNTQARTALHKFSEMLRYQLYEAKDEKISIEKEIQYLQDYIGLQTLRSENCAVKLDVEPAVAGFSIEPFLLLPFVENSFKHLSHFSNGKKNQVAVSLEKKNGTIDFCVRNTTETKIATGMQNGIGLLNVKRRLELLYPEKHQLIVQSKDDWFSVRLQLKIEQS